MTRLERLQKMAAALDMPAALWDRYAEVQTAEREAQAQARMEGASNRFYLDGIILLSKPWWCDEEIITPRMVREFLDDREGKPVTICVNSIGGIHMAGEQIRTQFLKHEGEVRVEIMGAAYSAASLAAIGGDRVEMTAGSLMMVHNSSVTTHGTADDHETAAVQLRTGDAAAATVYAARMEKSEEEVAALMAEETYFGADEAIEAGLADAVLAVDLPNEPKATAGQVATLQANQPAMLQARMQLAGLI